MLAGNQNVAFTGICPLVRRSESLAKELLLGFSIARHSEDKCKQRRSARKCNVKPEPDQDHNSRPTGFTAAYAGVQQQRDCEAAEYQSAHGKTASANLVPAGRDSGWT
jgi:hypothetical protein